MAVPDRIVLVGPMGAGKSTIGKLLAKHLDYPFLDTDREIEARCGADIPWIFDMEGEAGFRLRESQIIAELMGQSPLVMATGGGAVLRPENRHHMAKAFVVYLRTSLSQQYDRTRLDRNRPLLQQDNPRGVLARLFAERDPLYSELADVIMKTDRKSPRLVVRQILQELTEFNANAEGQTDAQSRP
ncbi:MAG: shikimate kinase AroK [Halomonadaceae bacterium]|nr:MAG: shikimate kinase AroK [Halomonadaceae bacterium]